VTSIDFDERQQIHTANLAAAALTDPQTLENAHAAVNAGLAQLQADPTADPAVVSRMIKFTGSLRSDTADISSENWAICLAYSATPVARSKK
jgi:hypothetical protein